MRTPDYYLTTVLKDTKKTGSHCAATASRFAPFFLNICAKLLEPLGHQRSSVDGLITPTLKAAGSNPVGRTKNSRKSNIYESFLLEKYRIKVADLTTISYRTIFFCTICFSSKKPLAHFCTRGSFAVYDDLTCGYFCGSTMRWYSTAPHRRQMIPILLYYCGSNLQSLLQNFACCFLVLIKRVGIDVQRCGRLAVAQQARHRGHVCAVGN